MDFPASPATPGQQASRASWQALQQPGPKPQWWDDYLSIREAFPHFNNWRVWVYIAWAGQPAAARDPRTIEELAENILGCSSRVVRKWRDKKWGDKLGVDDAIAWVQAAPLLRSRREYFETLEYMATQRDHKHFPYLKLALEMTGDYRPAGAGKPEEKEQEKMADWLAELRKAA